MLWGATIYRYCILVEETDILPQVTSRTRNYRNYSRIQVRTQLTCRFYRSNLFFRYFVAFTWIEIVAGRSGVETQYNNVI